MLGCIRVTSRFELLSCVGMLLLRWAGVKFLGSGVLRCLLCLVLAMCSLT